MGGRRTHTKPAHLAFSAYAHESKANENSAWRASKIRCGVGQSSVAEEKGRD